MSTTVTFKAIQRRFERSQNHRSKICTLSPRERQGMHGSRFALIDGNSILDAGDLGAVERWCQDAGVLHPSETIVA
ncbi:hypothetical protein [Bradyrhizobium sp. 187]|uniref:hypothetical protein n=2 Tax=Bradyrhizobium TaxID=374 RepID=UPI001FFEE200|nr:hypothetical protein [Bradyrhizobium sp. 187]UPJ73552.1 hypothetical protein IVB19_02915 [Bradyrhizobium sp. 187]